MRKHPTKWTGYLAGVIIYIIVNAMLISIQYVNYKEKMELFCEVVEADKNGEEIFTVVTELLKGTHIQNDSDKLRQYGYLEKHISIQRRQFYYYSVLIVIMTTLVAGAILLGRNRQRRQLHQAELERLEQISRQIQRLREGNYRLGIDQLVESENKEDKILRHLNVDMVSLAEQLELVTKSAHLEKEETKTLVTDLSHQLKTPVAALKASLEILNSPELSQTEQAEFLARCTTQIGRLEELVNALVQISRMETGMIEVHLEEKPILDTIRMAVNRIYVKAQEKDIDISLTVEKEDEELRVMQDVKWLSEAFINILENAVKYSGRDTHIQIRLERRTAFLRLEIEDEGIGVPRAERSQIFQRFYRGQSEQVKNESGSGVGLYLSRMIIEKHSGTITIRPSKRTERSGSVFVIQIPPI